MVGLLEMSTWINSTSMLKWYEMATHGSTENTAGTCLYMTWKTKPAPAGVAFGLTPILHRLGNGERTIENSSNHILVLKRPLSAISGSSTIGVRY